MSGPVLDLTRLALKRELYEGETFFRQGLAELVEAAEDRAGEVVHRTAMIVIKPDGMASGVLPTVLDFLADMELDVVGVHSFAYSRLLWHALWRFQLTSATLDRLAVNEVVLDGTALLILLRDRTDGVLPATVRLSSLKGSADVSKQRPGTLRSRLRQPNRVLSLVHVPDEPADLVRELPLLLDRRTRRRAWSDLVEGRLSDGGDRALQEAADSARRASTSFDVSGALERAADLLEQLPADVDAPARVRSLAALAAMRRGERIAWRPLAADLDRLHLELPRWDLAVLGTTFITYDEPDMRKVIENVDPSAWTDSRPASA